MTSTNIMNMDCLKRGTPNVEVAPLFYLLNHYFGKFMEMLLVFFAFRRCT